VSGEDDEDLRVIQISVAIYELARRSNQAHYGKTAAAQLFVFHVSIMAC
jgi:hypothetical protein